MPDDRVMKPMGLLGVPHWVPDGSILTIITIRKDIDRVSYMDDTAGKGEYVRVELSPALTMGLYGQGI